VKDREKNSKDYRRDPYHVVSDFWVAHGEIDLLTALLFVEIDFSCTNQIVVVFPCVVFQIVGDR
jgi:hypothetical protein